MSASSPDLPSVTLGLEEEVFVLYGDARHGYRASTASFRGLARLLWADWRRNVGGTASNFRRGTAARRELMSSVEISTPVHAHPDTLFMSAMSRRRELARALAEGLMVPLGLLPGSDEYHTAGLHIHVGVPPGRLEAVYGNLARYLPVLAHASASSPWWNGQPSGPLSRVPNSFALGPLTPDPLNRFQDLIVTRRLGTIELRVLDPVWEPERLHAILSAVYALARLPERLPWSRAVYNRLRATYHIGPDAEVRALAQELRRLCGFDPGWLEHTVSARVLDSWQVHGEAATLAALDGAYRTGTWGSVGTPHVRPGRWQGVAGFASYYVPKLPYMLKKVRAEHHAEWSGGELKIGEVEG
ncbi:glutamate-cysteine ligase family protein [Deinococcus altitudinis]|uniref:glutamate-cysteine ligase family protein n=1 Tax=Deinococcus altitudinis TaxID=468914 RepID=UPI003891E7A8